MNQAAPQAAKGSTGYKWPLNAAPIDEPETRLHADSARQSRQTAAERYARQTAAVGATR